ncbi:MAG: 7-cyano-7-deazaguanine synthase [Patescibacteria group bacterium]|jgi:7-cyano-7-deazaguanine synthase in queuosine biosynthesis
MKKNNQFLKKINKKAFNQKLSKRNFENLELIDSIEKHFIKKRGYVFRMPKPGEPVILLYSGGLDSTIAWAHLIEKYKLHVYPLILREKKNLGQQQSIRYFKKFFKKKYGNYYHQPLEITSNFFPSRLFKRTINLKKVHPEVLLNYLTENFKVFKFLPGLNALSPISGLIYQKYLENQFNIKIKAIFLGVLAGDGTAVPTQTFTYLRKTLLFLDDFVSSGNLQIASLFFERELGLFCEKKDIMGLGFNKLRLPLEKTYSCYRGKFFHCNSCLACYSRNLEFKKANILDKTLYYDKLFIVRKAMTLGHLFKYYLSKLKKGRL